MIKAGEYNNSLIEGNWSIALPNPNSPTKSIAHLWHYCPKSKVIRIIHKGNFEENKAICIDCKEEPSEVFMTTFMML
jgi:hypothetical protein